MGLLAIGGSVFFTKNLLCRTKNMRVEKYNQDDRSRAKERSRDADQEALESGEISREELQHINGGRGVFRRARIRRIACRDSER